MVGLFYFMEYLYTDCELCNGTLKGSKCHKCEVVWNNVGRKMAGMGALRMYMTFDTWEEHRKKYSLDDC